MSETWESNSHPESAIAVSDFNVFSTLRTDKRGGGVAVYVKQQIMSRHMTEYDVPDGLECAWIWTRPRRLPRPLSAIIVCGVYFPPSSPNGDLLIDHLLTVSDKIRGKHPDCGIAILGDFNRLDTSGLCRGTVMSQVVRNNTRGNAMLDLIVTNMKNEYHPPTVLPPVGLSDHLSVLWSPKEEHVRIKPTVKHIRHLSEQDLFEFGRWATTHDWSEVYNASGTTAKANAFHATLEDAIATFFPIKTIKTLSSDKPWITPNIKRLIALRQKAFHKQSPAVWKLYRNMTHRAITRAKKNHFKDRVASLKTAIPRKWHQEVMNMANARKGETAIKVPGLDTEDNAAIANAINSKFAGISQSLPPLDFTTLPSFLPASKQLPPLQVWDVYKRLLAIKSSKAPGPDSIPLKLLREFACEFADPFCHILNTSFAEGLVPSQWKEAVVVPIPKSQPPTLDQLRPISLTSQFSKIAEYFALNWILNDIDFDSLPRLKLLGVFVQNNLRWDKQVYYMEGTAAKKLYFLKRLKRFNLSHSDLTTIYTGYIRPILEYAAPAWS
ncbi:uncharacterized protein LOC144867616 [Branchiostoma floridae x Branchiostoma japonicum]